MLFECDIPDKALYRAKHLFTKEWVEGCLAPFPYHNGEWLNEEYYPFKNSKEYKNKAVFLSIITVDNEFWHVVPIDPKTIGRFTGLTANGKKIFEGDILDGINSPRVEVFFNKDAGAFQLKEIDYLIGKVRYSCGFLEDWNYRNMRVIGNIHDNPELLKGGVDNESNS